MSSFLCPHLAQGLVVSCSYHNFTLFFTFVSIRIFVGSLRNVSFLIPNGLRVAIHVFSSQFRSVLFCGPCSSYLF